MMKSPTLKSGGIEIRDIDEKDNEAVKKLIHQVMMEMGADGAGFALHDDEVNNMYDAYRGQMARYFVLKKDGQVVRGGGFAHLKGASDGICELRKMYFYPGCRGLGLGRRLLDQCLFEARIAGYEKMYIETLDSMERARKLYDKFGFIRLSAPLGETGHHGCNLWYIKDLLSAFMPSQ